MIIPGLAAAYCNLPGPNGRLISKNREVIRPGEVCLVALVGSNAVNYMFTCRPVEIKHISGTLNPPTQ